MPHPHSTKRVVIIGAGIAGLTCGHDLQRAGFQVTVLEAAGIPGGRMGDWNDRSFHQKYTGATTLSPTYTDMWELLDELGLKDELVRQPDLGTGLIDTGNDRFPIDLKSVGGLLRQKGLSARSKLRLPFLLRDLRKAGREIDGMFMHTAAHVDDETLPDYLTRKVGADFLENIVAPPFRNFWTWNAEEIGKAYFLAIYKFLDSPNYYFKNGMGALSRALAAGLDVQYRSSVSKVVLGKDAVGRTVHYTGPDGAQSLDADIVIMALRGDHVQGVVANMAAYESDFFESVPYAQFAMVHFLLKDHPRIDIDSPIFMTRANRTPVSYIRTYRGDLTDPRNPPQIWVVLAPERLAHYLEPDGANLEQVARRYVREFYPALDEDVKEVHPMFRDYVIAKFPMGQARRVKSFLATQEAGPKNIYYIGDYLSNATTGGSCAIARRTAKLILRDWGDKERTS